jgi:NAD(P)-dependent dehydrogenase (short-subunit alcohol dehydrogenase family)
MRELRGRIAVVTGAASGIGLALARRFCAEGMKVVLADVEKDALERATAELAGAGHAVLGVPCDVRSQESVFALASTAQAEFGAVHVVCNNAGVARAPGGGYMWEWDLVDWTWILSVNVMGVVHGIRAFLPILLAQDEGHVVNTSSANGGISPMRALPIYAASKSAVTQISECLYGQLAAVTDRVGVSVLYPGPRWLHTNLWTAERNRPPELAASKPRPTQSFEALKRQLTAAGVPFEETPLAEVAELALRGIREKRFWLIPESESADASIRARAESMLLRRNPDYMIDSRPPAAGGMGGPLQAAGKGPVARSEAKPSEAPE